MAKLFYHFQTQAAPLFPLNLHFPLRRWGRRLYCHGLGGSVGGPSCTFFSKGVTELYWSTNIHGSTTLQASVSVSMYYFSFSLYLICFMILFDDPFVITANIVYLISFFVHQTIIIYIMCILLSYFTQECIVNLKSFFDHKIIVFSRVLCSSSISMLKYKYLCKIYHDLFTIICTHFLIYSLNLTFKSL